MNVCGNPDCFKHRDPLNSQEGLKGDGADVEAENCSVEALQTVWHGLNSAANSSKLKKNSMNCEIKMS